MGQNLDTIFEQYLDIAAQNLVELSEELKLRADACRGNHQRVILNIAVELCLDGAVEGCAILQFYGAVAVDKQLNLAHRR